MKRLFLVLVFYFIQDVHINFSYEIFFIFLLFLLLTRMNRIVVKSNLSFLIMVILRLYAFTLHMNMIQVMYVVMLYSVCSMLSVLIDLGRLFMSVYVNDNAVVRKWKTVYTIFFSILSFRIFLVANKFIFIFENIPLFPYTC